MTTGDLSDNFEIKFEWKIKDFLNLPYDEDERYESPEFSFCGISWELWIYPNGYRDDESVNYISLFVAPKSLPAPISVEYSFHFKTVDGKADTDTNYTDKNTFEEEEEGYGTYTFMRRSSLIERKSELLPSEILTVICSLKKSGTSREAGVLKLQENLEDILQNGNLSDVVLQVGDQKFNSHRCLLAARSPVFLAMMTHDTKEKNTGVVNIRDVDSNTLSDFLRYLYTGNGEIITSKNVVKLYSAADKYQVDELKKSCRNYMLVNISIDNFCDICSLSLLHVEKDLTDACSQFFVKNTEAIISTPMWLTFLKENFVAGNELFLKQVKYNVKNKN